jgi:hypothetical protein
MRFLFTQTRFLQKRHGEHSSAPTKHGVCAADSHPERHAFPFFKIHPYASLCNFFLKSQNILRYFLENYNFFCFLAVETLA